VKHTLLACSAIISLGAIASLTACNNNIGTNPNNKLLQDYLSNQQQSLQKNMETPIRLGNAIDSRTYFPKALNCMANKDNPIANNLEISNQHSTVDFSSSISSSAISDLMNVGLSGKANFGLYSASISAQYARSTAETRQSLHFNYLQTMSADASYKVPGIGNKALSQDAQELLNNGGGLTLFHQVCGDSFIQAANMGAVLFVDVSIEFQNSAKKEQFTESVNVKAMGIGGITQSFSKERDKSASGANLAVKAYQLGGDSTKLANIFGKPGADGNYNIKQCTMQDISACERIINDIVSYAQGDFSKNVNFKDLSSLYTFTSSEMKYEDLGIKAQLPDLSQAEQEANKYLATTITHDREMLNYLKSYRNQGVLMAAMPGSAKDELERAVKDYELMIKDYDNYSIIDSCYGDTNGLEKRCINAANQVKDMHKDYAQFIDFADRLSDTIVINSPLGQIKLIPGGWTNCNRDIKTGSNCAGGYNIYLQKDNRFLQNATCYIDTQLDNTFMKALTIPNTSNKMAICVGLGNELGGHDFYIRRLSPFNYSGLGNLGQYAGSWAEYDPMYDVRGYNSQIFVSPAKGDLLYSPI
jgi:hypothetical protein